MSSYKDVEGLSAVANAHQPLPLSLGGANGNRVEGEAPAFVGRLTRDSSGKTVLLVQEDARSDSRTSRGRPALFREAPRDHPAVTASPPASPSAAREGRVGLGPSGLSCVPSPGSLPGSQEWVGDRTPNAEGLVSHKCIYE